MIIELPYPNIVTMKTFFSVLNLLNETPASMVA